MVRLEQRTTPTAGETVRVHIVIPREFVASVAQHVGKRKRSAFIVEAVAAKLEREQLARALEATAGCLADDLRPEWGTQEKISAWVRELRAVDRDATERKTSRFDHM